MNEWLIIFSENAAIIINALAILIIVYGTMDAFFRVLRNFFTAPGTHQEFRLLYLHYARFLIGGLTFQLAADIIETAIAPSWDEIGQLAAIAAIRTFLNFFLERDVSEMYEAGLAKGEASSTENS